MKRKIAVCTSALLLATAATAATPNRAAGEGATIDQFPGSALLSSTPRPGGMMGEAPGSTSMFVTWEQDVQGVSRDTVQVLDGTGAVVPASVGYSPLTDMMSVTTSTALTKGQYALRVNRGITTTGGVAVAPTSWTFAVVDPVKIVSVTPQPGTAPTAGRPTTFKVTFNKDVPNAPEHVHLYDEAGGGVTLPSTITYDPSTATVSLTANDVPEGRTFGLWVNGGLKGVSGDDGQTTMVKSVVTYTYAPAVVPAPAPTTTPAPVDTEAPRMRARSPWPGQAVRWRGKSVVVYYNEPVNLTASSIRVWVGGRRYGMHVRPMAGTGRKVWVSSPWRAWPKGVRVTVAASGSAYPHKIRDDAGNVATYKRWSFVIRR